MWDRLMVWSAVQTVVGQVQTTASCRPITLHHITTAMFQFDISMSIYAKIAKIRHWLRLPVSVRSDR